MLDLTGLPVLDIAIGLAFFDFLLSIVASSVSEITAAILRLRAKNLETGIRVLLGSKAAADKFFANWRILSLHTPKWSDENKQSKSRKPSYIDPRTAALAIFDTFAPDAAAEAKKLQTDQPPSEERDREDRGSDRRDSGGAREDLARGGGSAYSRRHRLRP